MTEESARAPEDLPPGWAQRLENIRRAAGALFVTRAAIFREELGEKTGHLSRAGVALVVAAAFGLVSLLVFTGFLAAVLARLFDSAPLGLLTLFLLYAAIAAIAGAMGWKSLRQVRPGDFPVTREEILKDWKTVKFVEEPREEEEEPLPRDERFGPDAVRPPEPRVPDTELEERFRAEAE